MPPAPPTEFIEVLPPPGEVVLTYDHTKPASAQSDQIPRHFLAAMSVRRAVFVDEQHVPPPNELDAEDPRSYHWVAYISVATITREGNRKGSETTKVPAATVRLVPPHFEVGPPPPSDHPGPRPPQPSKWYDGQEPYARLGRLATLAHYRGLGLARLLVTTALEWAGSHPLSIAPLPSPTSSEAAKAAGLLSGRPEWKGLVLVHAQKRLERMYGKFGFETDPAMGMWMEEGIEHVAMWRRVTIVEEKGNFR